MAITLKKDQLSDFLKQSAQRVRQSYKPSAVQINQPAPSMPRQQQRQQPSLFGGSNRTPTFQDQRSNLQRFTQKYGVGFDKVSENNLTKLLSAANNPYIARSKGFNYEGPGTIGGSSIDLREAIANRGKGSQSIREGRLRDLIKQQGSTQALLNTPVLGDVLGFFGKRDELNDLEKQLIAVAAGYDINLRDVANRNEARNFKNIGAAAATVPRLFVEPFDRSASDEISRGTAQFLNPLTLDVTRATNPYFDELAAPQTSGGKFLGGVSEGLGFLGTMMLPTGAGAISSRVGGAIAGAAAGRGASSFLARLAPGAARAAYTGALQTPNMIDETNTPNTSLGGFLNPVARLQSGVTAAGQYGISTGVGGLTGGLLKNANPVLRAAAQGVAGGAGDVGFALARGVRDPGELAAEFGMGAAFGALTGQQDIDEVFGGAKQRINAPQQSQAQTADLKGTIFDNKVVETSRVTQQGYDQILRDYSQKVQQGSDPKRAYQSAVREFNKTFDQNLPVKAGAVDFINRILDPKTDVNNLNLPENVRQAAERIKYENQANIAFGGEQLVRNLEAGGEKVIYDLPENLRLPKGEPTKKAGRELYKQIIGSKYTADKGSMMTIISKLKGTWEGSEGEKAAARSVQGQSASPKQQRALRAILQSGSYDVDGFKEMAGKLLGAESTKITNIDPQAQSVFDNVRQSLDTQIRPTGEAGKLYDSISETARGQLSQDDMSVIRQFEQQQSQPNLSRLNREFKETGIPAKTSVQIERTEQGPRLGITPENFEVNTGLKLSDLESKTDKAIFNVQNRFIYLDRLGDAASSSVRKVLGSDGIAKLKIANEMAPVFEKAGLTTPEKMRDFDVYLTQKRNANEAARGRKGATAIEYKKGGLMGMFGVRDKVEVPDNYKVKPEFEEAAQMAMDFAQSRVDEAYRTGIFSDESYQALSEYGDYVPFQRWLDDATSEAGASRKQAIASVTKQDLINKYTGSDKSIKSPLESIINQALQTEKLIQRNSAAQAVVASMQKIPDFADVVKEVKNTEGLDPENYIAFLDNGKPRYFTAPEPIVESAKFLRPEQVSPTVRVLSMMSSPLRKGATSANLDFLFGTNIIRDQFNAAINSKYGFVPGLDYKRGLDAMVNNSAEYKDFLASGGDVSFGVDPADTIRRLSQAADTSKVSKFTSKMKTYTNPFKLIEDVAEYSDTPTRVGIFMRALDNGATKEQAAMQARSATADFSVKGANPYLSDFARVTPFLNAAIQGQSATISAFKNKPKETMMKFAAYAIIPTLVFESMVEQTPVADQVSDYDRDKYFIIPIKGAASSGPDDFVRIPKPEFAQVLNPLRYSMKDSNISATTVLASMASELMPFDAVSIDYERDRVSPNLSAILPQGIKPLVEVVTNYDTFRNRNIVAPYKQNLPSGYQYNSNTAPIFRQLGEAVPDFINPAQAQHIAYGYTGAVGAQVADFVGRITGAADEFPKKDRPGSPSSVGIPVLNRILGVDLRTPEEQAASNEYAARDLKAEYNAILRNIDIPDNLKQIYLEDVRRRYQNIQ